MIVNETIMANKLRRSKTLSLLLVVLFTLSTMSLPACSDNDNNTSPQRVVQATVFFEDEGPVAIASVLDGAKNLVSDAIITINGRPLELHFLGDELWEGAGEGEGNVPYFYLEMRDLKGGDSLTLVAKHSDGRLIYAPASAQMPMPIELVEPSPDQTIFPGEEVVVRWVGGEGATHVEALYVPDQEGDVYQDVRRYGDVEQITVPSGVIKEGGGIIAAAAMSGDHPSFNSGPSEDAFVSSFVVSSYQGGHWEVTPETALGGRFPPDRSLSNSCPEAGTHACKGAAKICLMATALLFGYFLWNTRYNMDKNNHPPCDFPLGFLGYCQTWISCQAPIVWVEGCLCPGVKTCECYD